MGYKVIQWSTGNVGRYALRAIIGHPELELAGVWVSSEAKAGKDAGELAGTDPTGVVATNDTDAAAEFYSEVFGWVPRHDDGPVPYTEWMVGDKSVGGMMKIDPNWGPVPPHWAVYVSVPDCDATVAKALELGAELKAPAMDIPEVGRFAALADPTGAVFSVITLTAKHF